MLEVDQLIELEILARQEVESLEAEHEAAEKEEQTRAISPDKAIGRLSRLDSMQMQEIAKDAARRRVLRLTELRHALTRMDNGDYGFCETCREVISFDRLSARPEVRLCEHCA